MTNWNYGRLTPMEKKYRHLWKGYSYKPKGDRMNEPKHSPLPFKMYRAGEFDATVILDNDGGGVARVSGKADADLIVRAVNAHEDLVGFVTWIAGIECGCRLRYVSGTTRQCIHQRASAILDKLKTEGRTS